MGLGKLTRPSWTMKTITPRLILHDKYTTRCMGVDITLAGLAISTPRSGLDSDALRSSASIGLRPVLRDLAIKHTQTPSWP
jgi:hypothetical protein